MKLFYILALTMFSGLYCDGQEIYTYEEFIHKKKIAHFPFRGDTLYRAFSDSLNVMYDRDQLVRKLVLAARANKDSAQEVILIKNRNSIDSLHQAELKDLIEQYSYPTRYDVGQSLRNIGLLVVHATEDVNDLFLEKYYDLALKGMADWFLPERIEVNLLWRFERDGYRFFKQVQLNQQNELQFIDKTFFELAVLAISLGDNKDVDIELRATSNLHLSKDYRELLLKQLAGFLIAHKVGKKRVTINTGDVVEDKYYDGKPLFAFILSKNK